MSIFGGFQLKELFLIHKDGRMVWHSISSKQKYGQARADEDIFSGMLTIIQTFTKDSFGPGRNRQLTRFELGDVKVRLVGGEFSYMAIMYDGKEKEKSVKKVASFLNHIERKYGESLENWDGRYQSIPDIGAKMELFMEGDHHWEKL